MCEPPCGGYCMRCVICDARFVADVECVSDRIAEQVSRETCSEMRSDTHSMAALTRTSQIADLVR
eukprot:4771495-Lingulodinium_polyedra.AAC.1